ncbi:sugar ABC transporter permease [Longispora fulva]|uniref:Autoinducer 2 import system permease protein LsrD n=1 Tax=Longispora fulva TaxID=619741 RepID=A0A8J7KQQ0_9ACTN|nr:ABC transporter permease [Longispora fulva]MBG6137667.1 simple sugar transport system permease protein [Longispora fulva]GIG62174.1 sugar ABC transporter permease [Longispora fulva]
MTAVSATGGLRLARLRDLALVPAIIVIAVVGYLINPVFLHWDNLVNVLQQQSEISLLVLAQALVLIAGKMDLSLESTFGLAPGVAAWLVLAPGVTHGLGVLPGGLAVPVTLAVGALIGLVNGLLIVKFQLNGFIVTLGMLIVLRGLLTGISGGKTFFNLPQSFLYLGNAVWLGLPASIWICVALFAAFIVIAGFTRFGRSLYAIGGNPDAARAAGIRVDRVLWTVLIIAGVLAALGGLLLTGRLASVAAAQGQGAIFTVFAAAVIGGVSLNGGKGTIFGAFTGILLLYLVQNVLTLAGVPAQWIGALNGAIILVALMLARVTSGRKQE